MTGNFFLDWTTLAVSLHNTILLLWLGLTVLLNADKRTWGIWLNSIALLLGSAFFFSHTAILGIGINLASDGLDFWWHLGWVPVVLLPYGWYAVTLWYAGFFDAHPNNLRARQRGWFAFASLLTFLLIVFLAFANPLPSFADVSNLQLNSPLTFAGIPILLPLYIGDIFLCILLSLDVLMHPAPSPRMMGNLARQRARPWVVATAIVLLFVGLLVAWVIIWVTSNAQRGFVVDNGMVVAIGVFDLAIAALIAASIIFIGQAIALYEVFTGKVLPRRGLVRHWHNAVLLAIGYGIVIGWAMTAQLRPIYSILLTTALLTIFYALLGWRTYAERDHFVRDLRPFVASQRLYEQMLTTAPSEVDVATPFRALCRDVLNTRTAFLAAAGPLASFVPPLAYPTSAVQNVAIDLTQFDSPQTMCVQIDATHWAVPLWSERGLIGVLTLGEKIDDGMYAQEEIEIARATGERLIDTCASAELARRLMELQRQHLTETQLLDRQARRVLHDDVLPQIHAALLTMSHADAQATQSLMNAHRQISNLLRDMPTTIAPSVARLGLIGALKHTIDNEWKQSFDSVTWDIEPGAEEQINQQASFAAETIFYAAREAIRNAARYGRGQQPDHPLNLRIAIHCGVQIIVEDDGVGVPEKTIGQNGHGLALHSTMLAVIGGTLSIEPRATGGTRVVIALTTNAR